MLHKYYVTCFMGNLKHRIHSWHPFLNLTRGKVNVKSNQVKLCQISIFKIYLQKHAYHVQFSLRILKMSFVFMYNNWKYQKCVSKSDITLILVFGHCTAKNKNVALKLCMYVDSMYSVFDILKILIFIGKYFWKIEILNFAAQIRKILKSRDSHFVEHSILCHLTFFDCVLPQNWAF